MASTTATETVASDVKVRRGEQPVAPVKYPDVNTLRKAIPPYCFVPSTWMSLYYLARDLLMASSLVYAAINYIPLLEDQWFRAAAWITYAFLQSLVGTGLWIIGHECGHGAFSVHQNLNDVIGWAVHCGLGVPYFSWKFSHARHHMYTGHIRKDMTFVPDTAEEYKASRQRGIRSWIDHELLEDAPILTVLRLIGHQIFGFPMYLLFNVTAGKKSLQKAEEPKKWWRLSHLDPFSTVFRPQEAVYVFLSDVGLGLVGYGLYSASKVLGASTVCLLWVLPYFWVHHWLVAITYLHHHHADVKHYDENGWTYIKGALGTIDRDFGLVGKYLFHGIIETHVVHHIFSRIPFYYQEEATEAIKPILGDLYHRDPSSFHGALWNNFTELKYVEADPQEAGALRWHKQ